MIPSGYTWNAITTTTNNTTGAVFSSIYAVQVGESANAASPLHLIEQGAVLKFSSGRRASVIGIIGDGTGLGLTGKLSSGAGAITLSTVIATGDTLVNVRPPFRAVFTASENAAIVSALMLKTNFGLRYDAVSLTWKIITYDNLSSAHQFSLQYAGNTSSTNIDASWLIKLIWNGTGWTLYERSLRYVFESVQQNRFYFENTEKVYDPTTGNAQLDYVSVLSINADPITGFPLNRDYQWQVTGQQIYPDGYADPRSIRVTMWQGLNYGIPDDPAQFVEIVNPSLTNPSNMLFWQESTGSDGYMYWNPITIPLDHIFASPGLLPAVTSAFWIEGAIAYVINTQTFWQYTANSLNTRTNLLAPTLIDVSNSYKMRIGRGSLKFLWKHYSPTDQRINPAVTNVIDMYVLTNSYDTNLRNWISTNGAVDSQPQPPTSAELKSMLSVLELYKQMTDTMIWHPVSYKVIFGSQSAPEYRVKFLVVKTAGTTVTDNEVKSMVIQAVNSYFSLNNWDFGQSFFFTELAAYIHQSLATVVGSVVILPLTAQAKFGDLFEINCDSDEIFISSARVTDVQIVPALTETALGINNG